MAPEFSIADSAVCSDFDPMVRLQVGFVDNNGVKVGDDNYTEASDGTRANDGVDVGWVTDSMVAMTVKHHFNGVARGQNFSVTGPEASKGSNRALAVTNRKQGAEVANSTIDDADYKGALLVGTLTDGDNTGVNPCATSQSSQYSNPRSGLHKPDSCFRATSAGDTKTGINYLGGYSIELAAKDAGVSWGKVAWDPNPFKDLKCESMTFMATDALESDVCDLFEDEVDRAMAKKWGGSKGTSVTFMTGTSTTSRPARSAYAALTENNTNHLVALRITAPAATSRRFASLWYNDNDTRTESKNKSNHDLYSTGDNATKMPLHIELVDEDGDPKYGDFGKVDFAKADGSDSGTVDDWGENGTAESAAGGESKCTPSDGEGCDGMLEEMITVTFDAGLALGCSSKRDVTISCTWDANGEMNGYRADDHHPQVTRRTAPTEAASTFGGFRTSPSSGRQPGDISAFVSCKVS